MKPIVVGLQIVIFLTVSYAGKVAVTEAVKDEDIADIVGLIGDICSSESDCSASFSTCLDGRCACLNGFKKEGNDSCSPNTRSCPHIGVVANPRTCLTMADPRDVNNSSCPADSYCLGYERSANKAAGHCCPKPQLLCPAGLPDPLNSCDREKPNRCDLSTHFCHAISMGTYNRDSTVEVCCKKPCADDDFFHEGKCYKVKSFGQSCEIHQQCDVKGAVCKAGFCGCAEGETFNFNQQFYIQFCSKSTLLAAPTPETTEETGKQRVGLNGNCSSDIDSFCAVAFSICLNDTCECADGFAPKGNGSCEPTTYSCPYTGVIGNPTNCTLVEDSIQISGSVRYIDSCPKDFHCLTHTGKNIGSGHCCPIEPLFCPVGSPDQSYNSGKCDIVANLPQCRNESHMCISTFLDDQMYRESCCPDPCPKGRILRFNTCLPSDLDEGDSCELDEQCMFDGACINGFCRCSKTSYYSRQYKVCVEATCPYLKPLMDVSGGMLRCSANVSCSNGSYCYPEAEICCPIPEMKCFDTTVTSDKVTPPPLKCDPESGDPCEGARNYCKETYVESIHTDDGVVLKKHNGVCCPSED